MTTRPLDFLVLRNNQLYRVLMDPLEVKPLEKSARRYRKRDEKKYQLPFKEFRKLPDKAQLLLLEVAAPIELAMEFRKEIKRRKNNKNPEYQAQVNRAKNILRKAIEGMLFDERKGD